MIWASSSSSKCCGTAFTEATVPTGMKTGVSTAWCGSVMVARRAFPLVLRILKSRDTLSIVPAEIRRGRVRKDPPPSPYGQIRLEVEVQPEFDGAGRTQAEDAGAYAHAVGNPVGVSRAVDISRGRGLPGRRRVLQRAAHNVWTRKVEVGEVEEVVDAGRGLDGQPLMEQRIRPARLQVEGAQRIEVDLPLRRIGDGLHRRADLLQLRRGEEPLLDEHATGRGGLVGILRVEGVDALVQAARVHIAIERSDLGSGQKVLGGAVAGH